MSSRWSPSRWRRSGRESSGSGPGRQGRGSGGLRSTRRVVRPDRPTGRIRASRAGKMPRTSVRRRIRRLRRSRIVRPDLTPDLVVALAFGASSLAAVASGDRRTPPGQDDVVQGGQAVGASPRFEAVTDDTSAAGWHGAGDGQRGRTQRHFSAALVGPGDDGLGGNDGADADGLEHLRAIAVTTSGRCRLLSARSCPDERMAVAQRRTSTRRTAVSSV